MILVIEKLPIDTSLFKACCMNERLHLVNFIYQPDGIEPETSLPILFESLHDTQRFFHEYFQAKFFDEPVYEFRGEAWFSLELYTRIRNRHQSDKQ